VTTLDDVVKWGEALAVEAMHGTFPALAPPMPPADASSHERATDAIRPDAVAALFRSGDARALRIVAPRYLEAAAPALDAAYRAARREAHAPWAGSIDAALAAEPHPGKRREVASAFASAVARGDRLLHERSSARDEAARRAGAASAAVLLAAGRDPGAAALVPEVERGFVVPTDDAAAAAMRDRARAVGLTVDPIAAEDTPILAWMPERRSLLPPAALRRTLDDLAASLGVPSPRFMPAGPHPATIVFDEIAPPALVVTGSWGGPRGLLDALEAFGRASRATFIGSVRGSRARVSSDPAFGFAAGFLFRGIVATAAGLGAADLPDDEALLSEIRLERVIDARRAWGRAAAEGTDRARRAAIALRAGTRRPGPGEEDEDAHDELDPVARLAGVSFALLLEERLLTRFGRAWFSRREAGSFLRDLWAAEPDDSPRGMAHNLALGTMDSAPLIEACRPPKGRVF